VNNNFTWEKNLSENKPPENADLKKPRFGSDSEKVGFKPQGTYQKGVTRLGGKMISLGGEKNKAAKINNGGGWKYYRAGGKD